MGRRRFSVATASSPRVGLVVADAPGGVPNPIGPVAGIEWTESGSIGPRPPEAVAIETMIESQLVAEPPTEPDREMCRLVPVIACGRGPVAVTDRRVVGLVEGSGALGSFHGGDRLAFELTWSPVAAVHLDPDVRWPVTILTADPPSAVRLRCATADSQDDNPRLFGHILRAAGRHHLNGTSVESVRRRLEALVAAEAPPPGETLHIDFFPPS